jgi:hypothetical protein
MLDRTNDETLASGAGAADDVGLTADEAAAFEEARVAGGSLRRSFDSYLALGRAVLIARKQCSRGRWEFQSSG